MHLNTPRLSAADDIWEKLTLALPLLYKHKVNTLGANRSNFAHPHYVYWHIISGNAEISDNTGNSYTLLPGNRVFFLPGVIRTQLFNKHTVLRSLHIQITWPDGSLLFQSSSDEPVRPIQFPEESEEWNHLDDAIDKLILEKEEVRDKKNAKKSLVSWSAEKRATYSLIEAFADAMNTLQLQPVVPAPLDPRLQKVLQILDSGGYQGQLDYPLFTAEAGISRSHLDRIAMSQLGCSLKDYLDRRIQGEASRLLLLGTETVTRLADELGFASASHFDRWFKKRTGETPGEYRKNTL